MKRVEVVVEREEINSTKFDGVKEWGCAGCLGLGEGKGLGKGRRSVSVSMTETSDQEKRNRNYTKRTDRINLDSASETPRTACPQPWTTLLPALPPMARLLQLASPSCMI